MANQTTAVLLKSSSKRHLFHAYFISLLCWKNPTAQDGISTRSWMTQLLFYITLQRSTRADFNQLCNSSENENSLLPLVDFVGRWHRCLLFIVWGWSCFGPKALDAHLTFIQNRIRNRNNREKKINCLRTTLFRTWKTVEVSFWSYPETFAPEPKAPTLTENILFTYPLFVSAHCCFLTEMGEGKTGQMTFAERWLSNTLHGIDGCHAFPGESKSRDPQQLALKSIRFYIWLSRKGSGGSSCFHTTDPCLCDAQVTWPQNLSPTEEATDSNSFLCCSGISVLVEVCYRQLNNKHIDNWTIRFKLPNLWVALSRSSFSTQWISGDRNANGTQDHKSGLTGVKTPRLIVLSPLLRLRNDINPYYCQRIRLVTLEEYSLCCWIHVWEREINHERPQRREVLFGTLQIWLPRSILGSRGRLWVFSVQTTVRVWLVWTTFHWAALNCGFMEPDADCSHTIEAFSGEVSLN